MPLMLDLRKVNYENLFLMEDRNVEGHSGFLKEFCDLYNLKNSIKVPTVLKTLTFQRVYLLF